MVITSKLVLGLFTIGMTSITMLLLIYYIIVISIRVGHN